MWRTVANSLGKYEVNELGQIRHKVFRRVIKVSANRDGYLCFVRPIHGQLKPQTTFSVHRVVAEAFLGPSAGLEVNHINGVKTDNRVENLEYVTTRQNAVHRDSIRTTKRRMSKRLPAEDVMRIRRLVNSYNNAQVARLLGTTRYVVRDVKNNRTYKGIGG